MFEKVIQFLQKTWDESKHPRNPAGSASGGEFTSGGSESSAVIAYHGTPHQVDDFSIQHVGEGQGVTSYGWGLYFAEEPKVAESYQRSLSQHEDNIKRSVIYSDKAEQQTRDFLTLDKKRLGLDLVRDYKDLNELATGLETRLSDGWVKPEFRKEAEAVIKLIRDGEITFTRPRGNLYQVKLDVKPSEVLDWDKPLFEQSPTVKAKLKAAGVDVSETEYPSLARAKQRFMSNQAQRDAASDIGIRESYREGWGYVKNGDVEGWKKWYNEHGGGLFNEKKISPTGERFYHQLASDKGNYNPSIAHYSEKAASDYLQSIGIPGLRYLDQDSRNDYKVVPKNGEWGIQRPDGNEEPYSIKSKEEAQRRVDFSNQRKRTRNYVIWDDSKVIETHVNGKPITEPAELKKALDEIRKYRPDQQRDEHGRWTDSGGGIVAYHGTPHTVDDFTTGKVGSGEGAQTFGWGLYFAEEPKVAEEYKKRLTNNTVAFDGVSAQELYTKTDNVIFSHASQYYADGFRTKEQLLGKLEDARVFEKQRGNKYFSDDQYREVIDAVKSAKEIGFKNTGNLYTVRIDVKHDELLDWDKPLREQSPKVKAALERTNDRVWPDGSPVPFDSYSKILGSEYYETLSHRYGSDKAASEKLNELGVPGLRYLDQGSRDLIFESPHKSPGANFGVAIANEKTKWFDSKELAQEYVNSRSTHNYVIWDDRRIIETHVNGRPLTKPAEIQKAHDEICKSRDWDEAKHPRAKDGKFTDSNAQYNALNEGKEAIKRNIVRNIATPEFKGWFKDSKVVNTNGTPKVVYHGTNSDFTDFQTTGVDLGAHFATEKAVANVFTRRTGMGEGGKVFPVYLSIQNPARLPDIGLWNDSGKLSEAMAQVGLCTKAQFEQLLDEGKKATGFDKLPVFSGREWAKAFDASIHYVFEKLGYDGIVYLNRREVVHGDETAIPADRWADAIFAEKLPDAEFKKKIPAATDCYIAFHPEQIKSVYNRGTFDSKLADIGKDAEFESKHPRDEAGKFTTTAAFMRSIGHLLATTPEQESERKGRREIQKLSEQKWLQDHHPELIKQAAEVLEKARRKLPAFSKMVKAVAVESASGDYKVNMKSAKSLAMKVLRHKDPENYGMHDPKDHVRGTIFLKDWSQVPAVCDSLSARGLFAGEAKLFRGFNAYGFRSLMISTKLGDGIKGEIQLHTAESWKLKRHTDELYAAYRKYDGYSKKDMPKGMWRAMRHAQKESYRLWKGYFSTVPEEVKHNASDSVKGLASRHSPAEPSKSTHLPDALSKTSGGLSSSMGNASSTRPSGSCENLSVSSFIDGKLPANHVDVKKDWRETEHPRNPAGTERGGEFAFKYAEVPSGAVNSARHVVADFQRAEAAEYNRIKDMSPADLIAQKGSTMSVCLWRERTVGVTPGSSDDVTLRFARGDKKAFTTVMRRWSKLLRESGADNVKPEHREMVQKAAETFFTTPSMQPIFDKFGKIPVIVSKAQIGDGENSERTPQADCSGNAITVYDVSRYPWPSHLTAGNYKVEPGATSVAEDSLEGILHHEYGHHVERILDNVRRDPRMERWYGLWADYKKLDEDQMSNRRKYLAGEIESEPEKVKPISFYSTTNEKELFAETFAAVTAPNYKRELFPKEHWPILEFMENIIK